jgi:hypothetical protein
MLSIVVPVPCVVGKKNSISQKSSHKACFATTPKYNSCVATTPPICTNIIAGLVYHHWGISKIFVTSEEVPGERYLHLSITTYEEVESTRTANKVPERGTEFSLFNFSIPTIAY